MVNKKLFEFLPPECESCQHYWNSTCDGIVCDSNNKCKSYNAIRSSSIEQKLNRLWTFELVATIVSLGLIMLGIFIKW